MKYFSKAMVAIAAISLAGAANAAIIFSDNFDGENGGVGALNYNSFAHWTVLDGTVDLIGNGFFDFLPGNGLYVDLDGSTQNAGIMGHLQSLATGAYTLSFDLAGNHRNSAAELVTANVAIMMGDGTGANQSFTLAQNDGFQTFSLDFDVGTLWNPAVIYISFGAAGGDNIGMLLDNVVLADRVAVPEPGSLALLGAGLLGLGLMRRKQTT